MNIHRLAIIGSLLLIVFFSSGAMALPLQNGDFSNGLAEWATQGDVTIDSGESVLGDNGEFYSLLYQGAPLAAGDYTIEFDFKNLLSGVVPQSPPFAFLDTFFASLYFSNDLSGFNLAPGGFDASISLFSLDFIGVYDDSGEIGVSVKGGDWQHLSLSFRNDYAYIIPVFELLDFNFVDNDSSVRIDNVVIQADSQTSPTSVVPEPATLVLMGCGLLGLLILKVKPSTV